MTEVWQNQILLQTAGEGTGTKQRGDRNVPSAGCSDITPHRAPVPTGKTQAPLLCPQGFQHLWSSCPSWPRSSPGGCWADKLSSWTGGAASPGTGCQWSSRAGGWCSCWQRPCRCQMAAPYRWPPSPHSCGWCPCEPKRPKTSKRGTAARKSGRPWQQQPPALGLCPSSACFSQTAVP